MVGTVDKARSPRTMRWAVLLLGLCVAAPLAAQDDFWQEELRRAQEDLRKGQLGSAESTFDEILASFEEDPEEDRPSADTARAARLGMLDIQLVQGDYRAVAKAIEDLGDEERRMRPARVLLARAVEAVGDYDRAVELWRGLAEAEPADAFAGYRLGRVLHTLGRDDDARQAWQQAVDRHGDDPVSVGYAGRCLIELGGRDNLERASALLVASIEAAPDRPEARTAYGLLKSEVYGEAAGFPSGERDLTEVLEQNGEVEEALLGLYRIRKDNYRLEPGKTFDFLERALSLNPHSVPALREKAIALLEDRRFEPAAHVLDQALEVDPNDPWTLAHRAAVALLRGEKEEAADDRKRALATDPGFAELDRVLGDHLVALYRFGDAIPHYRAALEQHPDSVPALQGLAKALIYCARGDEAVELLQRAAALQPGYNDPWRENALTVEKLLHDEYRTVRGDGFVVALHRDDADVLAGYLLPALEEARRVLDEKYGVVPDEDVRVEVLHSWADFSVRTIGFRGFTALGACFGDFITMVSPSDADVRQQEFMWTATAWHEYAHVLTLALSAHRVPRWLTEGLSVYEEGQRDPSWERGMLRELFDAQRSGEIPPLREMNALFRSSKILFGYYLGGVIVDYLAQQYGFDAVTRLLRGYADDRSTEDLFESVFGVSPEEFDAAFSAWVDHEMLAGLELVPRLSDDGIQRAKLHLVRHPDDLDAHVDLGWAYLLRDDTIDAAGELREVLRRAPEHPRGTLLHAELFRRRGAVDEAIAAYRKGFAAGADDFDSRIRFGRLLESQGDAAGAIEQFQRAKACWPRCTELDNAPELQLARVYRKDGRETEAMMELKAFVKRTGRAYGPRLELAQMEHDQGDTAAELELLQQANAIDPFSRELHVRLGEALVGVGKPQRAVQEYQVALAVPIRLDRRYAGKPASEIPDPNTEAEKESRADLSLRIARLWHELGNAAEATRWLQRTESENRDGDAAAEAARLRDQWR